MELSTFCVDTPQIDSALKSGATHLILEDPAVSLRSFSDEAGSPKRLATLVQHARAQYPDIRLSLNLDLLPHMAQLDLVTHYIHAARDLGIPRIRVQDPGLARLIQDLYPTAICHLATETGNANLASMERHSTPFTRQCFALDMALSDMKNAAESLPCEFEIMVQGPILIQYSQRRFLKGFSDNIPDLGAVFAARDTEYPGRLYRFYDNPHGHFMYLYFDRCLLSCLTELQTLSVHSWLIDARGESLAYLETALIAYRDAYTAAADRGTQIAALKALSERPQRPGFFRANLTDQERGTPKTTEIPFGRVIDVIKESSFTIQVTQDFSTAGPLVAITPEGKKIPLKSREIRDLAGNPVAQGQTGQLLRFFWQKGICSNSVIV
jgi:collagenase-like PrtC family protease